MKQNTLWVTIILIHTIFISIAAVFAQTDIILKKYDGSIEGFFSIQPVNGPNDYVAVRYAIPAEIEGAYKIKKIRFYNNDSQTQWPRVLIAQGSGNSPNLNSPVAEFNNVTGPTNGFANITTDIEMANLNDIFFVLKMPPQQSFVIPGGTGTGAAIGADVSAFQSGNLFSINGTSFSQLSTFNLGVEVTIQESSAPVPVELAAFNARSDGRSVLLTWTTLTESNNFGFDVERSEDKENFHKIGFIEGKGTTTNSTRYEFRDKDLSIGFHYYRLKQIDTDGSFKYSAVVAVETTVPSGFKLEQNYPNPFNPETKISYETPQEALIYLGIYNLKGQLIRTLVNARQPAGFHQRTWDGRDDFGREVASGVYIFRLQSDDFTAYHKLTLLR